MRVPQVTERMKEAPAHALRAVFAGIGQVLLVADRIRSRVADGDGVPPAAAPAGAPAAATHAPPETAAAQPASAAAGSSTTRTAPARSATQAAPARSATQAAPARSATQAAPARSATKAAPARSGTKAAPAAAAGPVTQAAAADAPAAAHAAATGPGEAAPTAGDLPVPHYDELSIASLRARMRALDPAQLRVLVDYENGHAARASVVAMFERRIAKIEAGEA